MNSNPQLNDILDIEVHKQNLFLKNFGEEKKQLGDEFNLQQYGLKFLFSLWTNFFRHGDRLVMEIMKDPSEMDLDDKEKEIELFEKPEDSDVEDDVDRILREKDGWVKREKTKQYIIFIEFTDISCQHGKLASCNRCISIAVFFSFSILINQPWLIQNHEPWASKGLKHIPFHAWIKHKQYDSGSNTNFTLQEDSYRIENTGKLGTKDFLKSTVTLQRQEYRHLDHVYFEDRYIIVDFLVV